MKSDNKKTLVIVESPAKATAISKYLGVKNYRVLASYGHVRDLPSQPGSVKPEEDFAIRYEINDKAKKRVSEIAEAASGVDQILLATDPDREGESISWHIAEILKEKKLNKIKILRISFNEITKNAVLEAVSHPRSIDMDLVDAQQARRALDYLVGFNISPILWRKLPGSRSAGRVQSVALRMICDREFEILRFNTQEYWTIKANLSDELSQTFFATLSAIKGSKLEKFDIKTEVEAKSIANSMLKEEYIITSVDHKEQKRKPSAPFTTSSLQQEASRKLGFTTSKTMMIAQKLYEGVKIDKEVVGLITYMRTDGVTVSQNAIDSAREYISTNFGPKYLPKNQNKYSAKAKNAQEAHEAIRPTNIAYYPDKIKKYLDADMFRLYEMIWKRMVASQMSDAVLHQVAVVVEGGDYTLRATGSTIEFDGFYKLYIENKDDSDDSEDGMLPNLKAGAKLSLNSIDPEQHFTSPPPRYTEASLVKKMEELSIGRPSTYATIISVLQDREYVRIESKRFVPEERGLIVTAYLQNYFAEYVEYDFTAHLEEDLDRVSAGEMKWKNLMRGFWHNFDISVKDAFDTDPKEVSDKITKDMFTYLFPDGNQKCSECDGGILLRMGKFGPFLACENYPSCTYTRKLSSSIEESVYPKLLGNNDGNDIYIKIGKYGPYLESVKNGEMVCRCPLGNKFDIKSLTIEAAVRKLSLPKLLGSYNGHDITADVGRYGDFIKYDNKFYKISNAYDITYGQAVAIIDEIDSKQIFLGKHSGKNVIALLENDQVIAIKIGRKKVACSFSKSEITLEKAINII